MVFTFTGRVTYISGVEQFGAGKESKRIIVEQGDRYPNFFPVTFYGDKMRWLDNIAVGDMVTVDTFPGGRLKKGDETQAFAYFNGNGCAKMNTGEGAPSTKSEPSAPQPTATAKAEPRQFFEDDVPF
jgi:hypothetical protein